MKGKPRKKAEGTVLLDVVYSGPLGTGYRREVRRGIELKESHTLVDLHEIIQKEMGWDDPHLYSFFMDGNAWSKNLDQEYLCPALFRVYVQGKRAYCSVDYIWYPGGRMPKSAGIELGELKLRRRRRFLYLFDFGDQHHFSVKVVGFGEVRKGEKYPKVLESKGKPPPQY